MRRSSLLVALATLSMLVVTPAARADDYTIPSAYFFLGGLNAFQDFEDTRGLEPDNSLGLDVRAGWRINDFLAAEIEGNFISGLAPPDTGRMREYPACSSYPPAAGKAYVLVVFLAAWLQGAMSAFALLGGLKPAYTKNGGTP